MCLVLGRIFGTCVIVLLSSNTVHFTSAAVLGWTSQPLLFISLSVPINGMAARRDMDIPISSDSVEDSDISDCNWDVHITGNPACLMMHPCRDRAVSMPLPAISGSQLPANDASTNTSNPLVGSGFMACPLSAVAFKCPPIHFTAFPCSALGLTENLAH